MTQTRNDRILAHYRSLRTIQHYGAREGGVNLWMQLARTWKMPIRELKPLIAQLKEESKSS